MAGRIHRHEVVDLFVRLAPAPALDLIVDGPEVLRPPRDFRGNARFFKKLLEGALEFRDLPLALLSSGLEHARRRVPLQSARLVLPVSKFCVMSWL